MRMKGMKGMKKVSGFTLVELMVVVTIVGVLVGLAVAGYDTATKKSRRAAAQGCLTEMTQFMERHYATNLAYTSATLPACSADVTAFYTISFTAAPAATTYTVQAVPTGTQVGDSCGTMTVNQLGNRTPATGCW